MAEIAIEQKSTNQKKPTRRRYARRQPKPIFPTALYDRRQAALVVGCSEITLIRAFNAGHLLAFRCGRYLKHSGQHLLDWMAAGGRTA